MPEFKAIYDSEEDIPETVEDFRSLFTQDKDDKWVLGGIAGIQTDANVARLEGGAKKERELHKETKKKLEAWSGLGDLEDVQTRLDRIPELEAAAGDKLDESALAEMAQKRADGLLRQKIGPLEREHKKTLTENEELRQENLLLSANETKRQREDVLRPLLVKNNVLPEHHEDAMMYAKSHFEQTEDGNFIVGEGKSVNGTVLSSGGRPEDWLGEMIERKPGWLPASDGSGGKKGSRSRTGYGGVNPWTADDWNVDEQMRIWREKGQEFAEGLAKRAGTSISAGKPAQKAAQRG